MYLQIVLSFKYHGICHNPVPMSAFKIRFDFAQWCVPKSLCTVRYCRISYIIITIAVCK